MTNQNGELTLWVCEEKLNPCRLIAPAVSAVGHSLASAAGSRRRAAADPRRTGIHTGHIVHDSAVADKRVGRAVGVAGCGHSDFRDC